MGGGKDRRFGSSRARDQISSVKQSIHAWHNIGQLLLSLTLSPGRPTLAADTIGTKSSGCV
jgi:hypothetical protein